MNALDRGELRRIRGIIANPGFEQVAEDVQGVGADRLGRKKAQELIGDRGAARVDVQI